MSEIRALTVGDLFDYDYTKWRYRGLDLKNVKPGDTYISIFGGSQRTQYKQFVECKDIKILYDSGPRWNNAHGMVDRTKALICVVYERVANGENSSVRAVPEVSLELS